MKSREEILVSFYDFHRACAAYHLRLGNESMLKHHYSQMEIVGAEIVELRKEKEVKPIEKPSAIDAVKFVAMSGVDSMRVH